MPLLGAPGGTNIALIDAIPLVALLGKIWFSLSGQSLNFLGFFALACFTLPGPAMPILLAEAGERNLAALIAGSVLAVASPYLLFRWGHLALCAQFLLPLALALYLRELREPGWRIAMAWFALLAAAILIHPYLYAMVAPIWAAALLQACLETGACRERR